jgi:protoporphyrinogen oxidase
MAQQRQQNQQVQAVAPVQQTQAVPQYHSGVHNAINAAQQQAQQHMPQVPTLSGSYYPSYGGQAMAQAPRREEQ